MDKEDSMNLKDTLEIILVTYNRKELLQTTFEQIFAENSPIKNLDITILDNKSTDGTFELIKDYSKKFPNIKHVINNRNIGGNANIAKAFETASKKYFWILCDDDEYSWDNWDEVENAIANDYDAIVVANYVNPKKNISSLFRQMTFVPSTIHRTENLTDEVMVNTEFNLSYMFAQSAIAAELINQNKRIYICDNWFVKMVSHGGEETYTRGLTGNIHPHMKNMLWPVGYLNTLSLIKDKKIRNEIIDKFYQYGNNHFTHYWTILEINSKWANNSLKNIFDIFVAINAKHKLYFGLVIILYFFAVCTIRIQYAGDKIRFIFCDKLKTDIRIVPKPKAV